MSAFVRGKHCAAQYQFAAIARQSRDWHSPLRSSPQLRIG
jgi:hypothetical protein